MSYDNRGRTASVAGVFGPTVSYGYDVGGNRTSLAIGGSTYASYGYDVANRLNTITDSGSLAVPYAYDNTNKLTSRTLPNGISTAYDYDGLNRLTRLRHTTSTATLTDNQYGYDSANRISQMTDVGGAHAYAYDSIDRLTSATYPGTTSESYTYDAVGNRTASHISASYADQPFNKVTSAGGATYTYDNNGNLLTKVVGTDTTQYAWDFENRLKQVTLPNGTVVNYKYDALGRRIQRTTSAGADERYVYDGQNVVQDLNSSSSVVTSYLNGPGLDNHLRQTNATTGVSYFLTDHLGSTVGLTDSSANLVEQLTYDSFGNHATSSRTRYTYTGRERDADTGLMYYRARFYDPQVGRFINEDPIGFNGGINHYAYVGNNPVSFIDPSGLCPQKKPYAERFAACCKRCLDGARLDNSLRDLGKSVGHPQIGELAADLTVVGTLAAIGNTALNLTSLGRYPRGGLGGASPAGNPTTWQHTVGGATGRALKTPAIGRAARLVGRASQVVSLGLAVFEGGYMTGYMNLCTQGCISNPDQ